MSGAVLFTFRQIPVIACMLEERGIDAGALLRESGLPLEGLKGEITAPFARMEEFINRCAERLNAPLFGIELANRIPRGAFGVTEFVIRSAPTIRDALAALSELAPLVNSALELRYVADARGCEVRYTFAAFRDALGMHLNEYTIAYLAVSFGSVLGRQLPLERVWFSHGRRDHVADVAERFGCSVTFQAPDCGCAVASEVIEQRPTTADPALFKFLLDQARAQLQTLGANRIVAQVTRVIESRFAQGDITAASIAEAMATTPRSLQRHLAESGTSFREVLAHVRRRRRSELERSGLAEGEIASRLGFANARTMRRSLDEAQGDDEPDDE